MTLLFFFSRQEGEKDANNLIKKCEEISTEIRKGIKISRLEALIKDLKKDYEKVFCK
ncbi:MAG: hypothetical protein NZ889_02515 [Candidatus Pacearchaeota archaeon]|nr:hypothetical protein [Candidatus Pacearchaeota archaeon]